MSTLTRTVDLPGRLGDPDRTIGTDPRADPRMVAVLAALGIDGRDEPSPVDAGSPRDAQLAFFAEIEPGFQALFGGLYADVPAVEGVERSTATVIGVDGNEIPLYVHRPAGVEGPLPAVLHIHGGGMTILAAADTSFGHWRDELAAAGMVVVGVEFRNAGGALGPHPWPAGLNDCSSALAWMHARRDELGISKIVVSGESGGGNLSLATVLKAKRDGTLDAIDGVYAQCPYISGLYATQPPELPSLTENDEYFLACRMMGAMAAVYTVHGTDAFDPLAWPYHATVDDLRGLPPHVISVNELDPLRDEGLAYFRKLLAAGVPTASRTVNGTCHAGDVIFRAAMPEVYDASCRDLVGFASAL